MMASILGDALRDPYYLRFDFRADCELHERPLLNTTTVAAVTSPTAVPWPSNAADDNLDDSESSGLAVPDDDDDDDEDYERRRTAGRPTVEAVARYNYNHHSSSVSGPSTTMTSESEVVDNVDDDLEVFIDGDVGGGDDGGGGDAGLPSSRDSPDRGTQQRRTSSSSSSVSSVSWRTLPTIVRYSAVIVVVTVVTSFPSSTMT